MPNTLHSARHRLISAAIKQARLDKGITQAQLAAALGRHQPFVVAIEHKQRRVDLVELIDIADVIDLDVPKLVKLLLKAERD